MNGNPATLIPVALFLLLGLGITFLFVISLESAEKQVLFPSTLLVVEAWELLFWQ